MIIQNRSAYDHWRRVGLEAWGQVTLLFVKLFCPVNIYLSGDYIFPQENAIVICNHLTYADWIWLWLLGHMNNRLKGVKIILKESPKYVPIFGWAMVLFEFIFLKRKWVQDKVVLKQTFKKASNHNDMWLMLFPEGTIQAADTIKRSDAFCEAHDMVIWTHVDQANTFVGAQNHRISIHQG